MIRLLGFCSPGSRCPGVCLTPIRRPFCTTCWFRASPGPRPFSDCGCFVLVSVPGGSHHVALSPHPPFTFTCGGRFTFLFPLPCPIFRIVCRFRLLSIDIIIAVVFTVVIVVASLLLCVPSFFFFSVIAIVLAVASLLRRFAFHFILRD